MVVLLLGFLGVWVVGYPRAAHKLLDDWSCFNGRAKLMVGDGLFCDGNGIEVVELVLSSDGIHSKVRFSDADSDVFGGLVVAPPTGRLLVAMLFTS